MNSLFNLVFHQCSTMCLERTPDDDSVYRVIYKDGKNISNLFGILPHEVIYSGDEYLMLEIEYDEFDERRICSLLSDNPDALGKAEINPFSQDESPTRIAKFTLPPDNKARTSYDEYQMELEFSDDLRKLSIKMYESKKEKKREPNPEWGRGFKGFIDINHEILS